MITGDDLLRCPSTDPSAIYRYRDGLYAADPLTAAMDCRGVYLAPAMAQRLDCARCHRLLDGLESRPLAAMALASSRIQWQHG